MCPRQGAHSFRTFQHVDNRLGVLRYGSNVNTNSERAIRSRVFQLSNGTRSFLRKQSISQKHGAFSGLGKELILGCGLVDIML